MISDRRDFLKNLMRNGLLGGFGILIVLLIDRSGKGRFRFRCPQEQSCMQCGQFTHCDLPRAGAARETAVPESDESEEIHEKFGG